MKVMIFDDKQVFVWVWLPGKDDPVSLGELRPSADGSKLLFRYHWSYLALKEKVSVNLAELPLSSEWISPKVGLSMPGCFQDGTPDGWGRRVMMACLPFPEGSGFSEQDYLLLSHSDRWGCLDFQVSADHYVPRTEKAPSLDELSMGASLVDREQDLSQSHKMALFHGTSLGGARPKAMCVEDGESYIVKFSSSSDAYNYIKAEYLAMKMAAALGMKVAEVKLLKAGGKHVLAVKRFDRVFSASGAWQRKGMLSALTLLELDEMMARYSSYENLTHIIRQRFKEPSRDLRELFSRLVFNILCGNTDDHARNHAASWDGEHLELTPAYDVCPQMRVGGEASQGMRIFGSSSSSQLQSVLESTSLYLMNHKQACEEMLRQLEGISRLWDELCYDAELQDSEKKFLWKRMFLNSFAVQGWQGDDEVRKCFEEVQKKGEA